jgi:hypothetical protein
VETAAFGGVEKFGTVTDVASAGYESGNDIWLQRREVKWIEN